MAAPLIVYNRPAAQALLYFSSNATVNVAVTNSTVDSDLTTTGAAANDNQLILGGAITKLAWSTDGTITIKRGANTVYTLVGTDHWDLRALSMTNGLYDAATLVVNCTSANASLYLEITKTFRAGNPNIGDH